MTQSYSNSNRKQTKRLTKHHRLVTQYTVPYGWFIYVISWLADQELWFTDTAQQQPENDGNPD